jgi:hypothetical protein
MAKKKGAQWIHRGGWRIHRGGWLERKINKEQNSRQEFAHFIINLG